LFLAPYEGCENIFRSEFGNDLFGQGSGVWRFLAEEADFEESEADAHDNDFRFELGTVLQYICPHKLPEYKPWRRPVSAKNVVFFVIFKIRDTVFYLSFWRNGSILI